MQKNVQKIFSLSLIAVFMLAGCQATNTPQTTDDNQTVSEKPQEVVDHGIPFTNGPSAPPDSTVGPTAPPPENDSQAADINLPAGSNTPVAAKAVTTNENIRITLPVKTDLTAE
jgi:hypothetical protein